MEKQTNSEGSVTLGAHFKKCRPGKQFLNHKPTGISTKDVDFLSQWNCQNCPLGNSNCNETVAWKDLRPALGWWCPAADMDSEWEERCLDVDLQRDADSTSHCRFYKCPYPAACVGDTWINGSALVGGVVLHNQSAFPGHWLKIGVFSCQWSVASCR